MILIKPIPEGLDRNPYQFGWYQPPHTPYQRQQFQARYSYRGPGVVESGNHKLAVVAIRVEVKRADDCEHNGLRHLHEFSLIERAEITGYGDLADMRIHWDHVIEHRVNGTLVCAFPWGHSSLDMYKAVHVHQYTDRPQIMMVGELIGGYRILHHDLPCCGGKYVSDKEYTGYSTLSCGHCADCGKQWEFRDGTTLHEPYK